MRKTLNKLWDAIKRLLGAGTTPEKLALTCALGVVVGTLPVWGITTWLCFLLAAIFRINVIILQLINYLLYPVQLILIIPFIQLGAFVFGVEPLPYSLSEITTMFGNDFWGTIGDIGYAVLLGVCVWVAFSVLVFPGIYLGTLSFLRKWHQNNQRELKSE